jgi:hypothetical protein
MITKYWKISVLKEGHPVILFATTTDAMIDSDLDGAKAVSLILVGRQFHRHPATNEQNHRDLAIAAIMAHAAAPLYDRTYAQVETSVAVPQREPVVFVGLVPIWEETYVNFDEE